MRFYFKYEIPKTTALADVLMDKQVVTTSAEKQLFT
jgi:butyryl-CoA dehydrogenase